VSHQPTVVWWRTAADRCLVELLVAGPAPTRRTDPVWPGAMVQTPVRPGAWAVVNLPRLGALPASLSDSLRAAASTADGGEDRVLSPAPLSLTILDENHDLVTERHHLDQDPLYEACRRAALEIVQRRLREETVAENPPSSGVLLARLHGTREGSLLQIAPALLRGGIAVTAFVLERVSCDGVELAGPRDAAADVEVTLLGGQAATLPAATFEPPVASPLGATVELTLPELHLPPWLQERWLCAPGGNPLVRLSPRGA
jgi:hypothetical protein